MHLKKTFFRILNKTKGEVHLKIIEGDLKGENVTNEGKMNE